eukprot:TRINITY_DN50006_c0_g1_i1.p1 TRINITY_DN50006_c0_g1~~TRINITY_DN50006_c0_g1_i1.p1  ORF type:complete len:351 (-),score=59.96 TRINITY_DN50006_c0_g1_i1:173-1225(-)
MACLVNKVSEVAVDIGGFAVNVVASAVQCVIHGVAVAVCGGLTVATWRQIDSLSKTTEDQAYQAKKKVEQAVGGMARAVGYNNPSFNNSPEDLEPWMAKLDDSTRVVEMFLPGTHDAVARFGGDLVQTQQWTINQQLRCGIRCFDLRFRMVGDVMHGHHGICYQHVDFGDVAEEFEMFLHQNPTEAIFVCISGSGCIHNSCREFGELLLEKISERGFDYSMWELFSMNLSHATLGQLRGRIVAFDGSGHSTNARNFQNEWQLGDADLKWEKVHAHATCERVPDTLFISGLNAVGFCGITFCTPSGMAYKVNDMAYHSVDSFNPGIYLMDYPGSGLVKKIVFRNFRGKITA